MKDISFSQLEEAFEVAKKRKFKYFAVRIQMDGFPKDELQLNLIENIDTKMEYMRKTYDEGLQHKFSPAIRIVDYAAGDRVVGIMNSLYPEEVI